MWSRRTPFVRMNFFGLLNFHVCALFVVFNCKKYWKLDTNIIVLGSFITMGTTWIFVTSRECNMGRLNRHGCRTHVLFCWRCLSSSKRRFSNSQNTPHTVSIQNLRFIWWKSEFEIFLFISKKLFDEHPEDSDYTPLPEDRPGGFAWGGHGADIQWIVMRNKNYISSQTNVWIHFNYLNV